MVDFLPEASLLSLSLSLSSDNDWLILLVLFLPWDSGGLVSSSLMTASSILVSAGFLFFRIELGREGDTSTVTELKGMSSVSGSGSGESSRSADLG